VTITQIIAQLMRRDHAVVRREAAARRDGAAERWPEALNAMADAVLLVDADYTVLEGNEAAMKELRRGADEFTGRSYAQMLYNTSDPPESCPLRRAIETGEAQASDIQSTASGRALQARCWPVRSRTGKVSGTVAVLTAAGTGAPSAQSATDWLYRALAEKADAGLVLVGPGGDVRYANQAFCAMVDRTDAEMIGRPIEEVVTDAEVETLRAHIAEAVDRGSAGGRIGLRRTDELPAPVEARLSRFVAGQDNYLVLSCMSARPMAAADDVDLPRAGMDSLECGVVILDGAGKVSWLNTVAAELFGGGRDSLVGRDYMNLLAGELYDDLKDPQAFVEALTRAHGRGQALQDMPIRLRRGDGEAALRYWSTPLDGRSGARGRVEHFYAPAEDETAAQKTDEETLERLAEAVPEMWFCADSNGRLTWCSRGAERTTGHPLDTLRGMALTELAAPDSTDDLRGLVRAALTGGGRAEGEVQLVRRDGTTFWAELIVVPAEGGGALSGILRDVTDRRLARTIRALLAEEAPRA